MTSLRLVPLGGLGEFGANSMLVERGGERDSEHLVVDAGAAFSGLDAYGVSYEVPDFGMLEAPSPSGLVLTHGHDDHVRGAGLLVSHHPACPVYGTRATLARAARSFGPHVPAAHVVHDGRPFAVGGFSIGPLPVSHSIPGTLMLRLVAEEGTIVVATDLRLEPSALGETTSREALAAWGRDGVDLLLLDATNALVAQAPPREEEVAAALAALVAAAPGAVVAVTFASHFGRFRQLADAARYAGRRVVAVGQGLIDTLEMQAALGGAGLPPGLLVPTRDLPRVDRDRVVIVATGSQGEPAAAFPQIAGDALPGFRLGADDLVIHAARTIPGSERRLANLFDDCVRRGARVVTASEAPVHASGHAHRSELEELLALLRPRWVVPVHGRRRHLEAVAELARRAGAGTVVVENGQEVAWSAPEARATGRLRGVGRCLFGDVDTAAIDPVVVRRRRAMAREGVVFALLALGEAAAPALPDPLIHADGFELPAGAAETLGRRLGEHLRRAQRGGRAEAEALRSTMTRWLRAELRRSMRRTPMVSALVLER